MQEAREGEDAPTLSDAFYEAKNEVLAAGYGVTEADIDSAWEKSLNGEEMTEAEELAYEELVARLIDHALGTEASVRRMASKAPKLARMMLDRISDMVDTMRGTNADRTQTKKLRRAELMLEDALDEIRERNKKAEKDFKRLSHARDESDKHLSRVDEEAERELARLKAEFAALAPADRDAWFEANPDVDREEFEGKLKAEQADKTIHFSLMNSDSLAQNVDRVLKMSDAEALRNKAEANFISIVKETPAVITENVSDAENLEVIMRFDAFYLATRHNGVLDGHYHNCGDIMKKLPEIIADPEAIVRMDNGRLNLFSQIHMSKGNYGVVSIDLNK